MKKIILCALFLLCLVVSSCKKTNTQVPTNTQSTSLPPPSAWLTATRSFNYYGGALVFINDSASAEFRSVMTDPSTKMQVNGVSVGGKFLKYFSSSKIYADTTIALSIIPTAWYIDGKDAINTYPHTDTNNLPGYSGYTSLPDTIYKTQNLNLQINGISNAYSIEVAFRNNTGTVYFSKVKSSGISINNTFTFSLFDLLALPSGSSSPTVLVVTMLNGDYNGPMPREQFNFSSQLKINKLVYVK